jgi:D-proline reductase (dithiol) PrdB
VSLVARYLEANGLPTVVIGSARDIVEHCGVARFLFSDFPLGNPMGHPWNTEMQSQTLSLALGMLESATAPRTTVRSPFEWGGDPGWRERYNRVSDDPAERERLLRIGDARRAKRGQTARESR